jgi:polar amino acid transport system substrate-binding protein
MQSSKRYHFEMCGTDFNEALRDSKTDLVVVTAPNNLHYEMVIHAAKAGKPIFVEKPPCVTEEQLNDIVRVQAETGAQIVVGFNRRYSLLVARIKDFIEKSDGPFLINYRVNADYIPLSRWVQDPEIGGGRIIAEGCHFFELLNFLLGSSTPSVTVECAGVTNSTTVARDNFVVVLRYPNGSVGSLVYSALGNRGLDRERIEIFGQGTAIVLDDFKKLTIYERTSTKKFTLKQQDKGHRAEFEELGSLLRGKPSRVMKFDEAVAAMRLTFDVEKATRKSLNPVSKGA